MSYGDGYYGGGPPVAAGSPFSNQVVGSGGMPGMQAQLNPPSRASSGGPAGQPLPPFMRTPVWPPQLLLSTNRQVAHQHRDYVVQNLNSPVNTASVQTIRFDIPCLVYAIQASVENTAALNTQIGANGDLNTFLCLLEHSNGDRLTTQACLGGSVFGSAELPRLIGGNGWVFDRGGALVFTFTPLAANMRINVNVWAIEERGPRNLTR